MPRGMRWPRVGSTLGSAQHHAQGVGVSALPRRRFGEQRGKQAPCQCRVFYSTASGSGPCRLQQHLCPHVPHISPAGTKREAPCHQDSRGSGPPAQHCWSAWCPSAARAAAYPSLHAGRDVSVREPWESECKYFIVNQEEKKKKAEKVLLQKRIYMEEAKKKGGKKKKPSDVLQPFMVSMPTTCRANSTTDGTCLAFPSQTRGQGRAGTKPPPPWLGTLSRHRREPTLALLPQHPPRDTAPSPWGTEQGVRKHRRSQVKLHAVGLGGWTDGWDVCGLGCAEMGAGQPLLQLAPTTAPSCCHRGDVPGSCPLPGGISHHPCSPSTRRAPQIPTAAACGASSRRFHAAMIPARLHHRAAGCRAPLPIPGCSRLHPRAQTWVRGSVPRRGTGCGEPPKLT